MVVRGFSLLELRKLYIDEFHMFYEEMIGSLEDLGEIKQGHYAKIRSSRNEMSARDTVGLLRKQMMKSITNKKK